jgi:hypothetical protein
MSWTATKMVTRIAAARIHHQVEVRMLAGGPEAAAGGDDGPRFPLTDAPAD